MLWTECQESLVSYVPLHAVHSIADIYKAVVRRAKEHAHRCVMLGASEGHSSERFGVAHSGRLSQCTGRLE